MLHMLRIHIRDNGDRRTDLHECAIALISFQDDPVAVSGFRVRAISIDDPAIDHGRIDPGAIEQSRNHRGGGRFSMRASYGDGPFQANDLSQHIGAAHNGNARSASRLNLDIIILDRAGNDDGACASHIFCDVANMDDGAAFPQPFDIGAFLHIGALNLIAEIDHDLGDARHANATNTNQVSGAERERRRRRFHRISLSE